jgi:hypothetical protein
MKYSGDAGFWHDDGSGHNWHFHSWNLEGHNTPFDWWAIGVINADTD